MKRTVLRIAIVLTDAFLILWILLMSACATLPSGETSEQAKRPHLSPFDDRLTDAVLHEVAEVGCDIVSHLDTQVAAISLNGGDNGIAVEIAQPARALLLDCRGERRILLIKE